MQKKNYTIAGHRIAIEAIDLEIGSLLPSFEPFESEPSENPLFTITIDNSIQPSWRGEKIGFFPCPSAMFEVYRMDNGEYQILVMDDSNIPCAFLQGDSDNRHFSITTRGNDSNRRFGLNNAIMVIFTICTAPHKTLLMHSSVIENGGKAYMFLGASGRGKSTHSDLWTKHIEGSTLINDDNPVLRIDNNGTPILYGSPWSGKRPIYKNVHYPVGGMTAIEQEKENRIRKEPIPAAFGILLCSCSTMKFDKKIHLDICATITDVLKAIPVHTLSCRPDKEAAELSHSTLKQ
ncbi:MAG: hypothetical protein IKJ49_07215 [Bacteroidaceae bacterium]|nr:hypothetical protein [Bacteroidaceae bacterium]